MKTALVISVYKNTRDLEVVLRSIEQQSVNNFEVIISEDGQSQEMKDFVSNYQGSLHLIHFTQEDNGWQKNKSLNNVIRNTDADYFIFIDGDCVLHPDFVKNHLRFAKPKRILAGKRIKLGEKYSEDLRNALQIKNFSSKIVAEISSIKKDGAKFYEEGVYISPDSILSVFARVRSITNIKGCNFSCYKQALIDINGFNEDYKLPAIGEDIDLTWRFEGLGYKLFSVRNFAVQYHLYHKENWSDQSVNEKIMKENQAKKQYVTLNGLKKL